MELNEDSKELIKTIALFLTILQRISQLSGKSKEEICKITLNGLKIEHEVNTNISNTHH